MRCACGHQSWNHGVVTFPTRRRPCGMCVRCNDTLCRCVQGRQACPCEDFRKKEDVAS